VFLAVPSTSLAVAIAGLQTAGLRTPRRRRRRLSQGLSYPRTATRRPRRCAPASGRTAFACIGRARPTRRRWSIAEPDSVAPPAFDEALAEALAGIFNPRRRVSASSPTTRSAFELAGVANRTPAALAAGATEAQGLNAAGAAAGPHLREVWRFAERGVAAAPGHVLHPAWAGAPATSDRHRRSAARDESRRNRRAGELLAEGVARPRSRLASPSAVEALQSVPLLAHSIERAGSARRSRAGFSRLIDGQLPLAGWVALRPRHRCRPRARWQRSRGFWQQLRERLTRTVARRSASVVITAS